MLSLPAFERSASGSASKRRYYRAEVRGTQRFPQAPIAASLTLNQLEVFATVAREGSFTRAGEVLARSEAAISQQI